MREGQIIVTGASRGIGQAIAVELDRRGFDLAALSRSGTSSVGTGYACDMTDEGSVVAAFAQIASRGPIIGLVNNAGAQHSTPSAELSLAEFEGCIRLNTSAAMVACREAYPSLKRAGDGLIVNIGSFFDKIGAPGNLAYCASKAALGAITRCLAAEWAQDGIRVLNVAPGYIETDLNRDFLRKPKIQDWIARRIPMARAGNVTEVAAMVGALFSENIPFLTGETIYVDGAHGIAHG